MTTKRYSVSRSIHAPADVVWGLLTDSSSYRDWNPAVLSYKLAPCDAGTTFSVTEEFTWPLSGLIAKSIPDLTDSFNQFADGLKAAAERTTQ